MKLTLHEKISNYIAGQPPIHWLKKTNTPDQSEWWELIHREQYCLSLAWRAKYLGLDEPLEAKVQSKEITKGEMTRAKLMVAYYSAIWDLVRICFTIVKTELKRESIELPFDSASDLFFRLCTEMAEYTFLHCLEPYIEVSGSKMESWERLCRKAKKTRYDDKKLEKLPHASYLTHNRSEWSNIVLQIVEKKATSHNPDIKEAWDDYQYQLEVFFRRLAKLSKKAPRYSYGFNNGKELRGNSNGTYSYISS
jgi:hypothetical protein